MGYADTHTQDILSYRHSYTPSYTPSYRDTDTTEDTRKDTRDTGTGYATYAHTHGYEQGYTRYWYGIRGTRYGIRDTNANAEEYAQDTLRIRAQDAPPRRLRLVATP